jgi:sortase (surface protein transpeptidase)
VRRRLPLFTAVFGVLLVAGCGIPVPNPAGSPGASTARSAPEPPAPTAITIPAIGAHSTLVPLGLTPERALEVPPVDAPLQAGYYAGADPAKPGDEVVPGAVGAAVVVGHVDGVIDGAKGRPGIFYRLREVKPGDEILIDRADGSQLRFVVERVEHHDKDSFPTSEVYGATPGPELRLITCGGSFDHEARSYRENIVAFARLA